LKKTRIKKKLLKNLGGENFFCFFGGGGVVGPDEAQLPGQKLFTNALKSYNIPITQLSSSSRNLGGAKMY